MLWSIPVDVRSHRFISKAWLFNAWGGRRRKGGGQKLGFYEQERSHSWDISPELHLEEEKEVKEIKQMHTTTQHPSLRCRAVVYKLNSEKRGQNSVGFCFVSFFPPRSQH